MAYTFNHTSCIYLFVLRIFIDYPQRHCGFLLIFRNKDTVIH